MAVELPTPGSDKRLTLAAAVERYVRDGDLVFIGGFGQNVPFAAAHELVRQGRRDLTLCRSGADILFDQLIAAGCVRKVIFGYLGNPAIGIAHAFRRAVEQGVPRPLEVEEYSNFGLVTRLLAGALGLTFLPIRSTYDSDLETHNGNVRRIECPYTGQPLAVLPALNPDVALVHVQRADRFGNAQSWGLLGDTLEGVKASRTVVLTCEEIVEPEIVKADPNRTVLPGFRVAAVVEAPGGAHPAYCQGYYGRDDTAYLEYDQVSRTAASLDRWLDEWVRGVPDRTAYLAKLGAARWAGLAVPWTPAPAVSYGFARVTGDEWRLTAER